MTSLTRRRFWQTALLTGGMAVHLLAGQAALAEQSVSNRYVRIVVDDGNQKFTIVRVDGDPLIATDDNFRILYQALAEAVKATLWVSTTEDPIGADTGIVGGSGGTPILDPSLASDGRSILSKWAFPDVDPDEEGRLIHVTQKVSLFRDLVRIEYTVENRGVGRSVGLRFAVDPATTFEELVPGQTSHENSSNPIFIPKQGFFSFETDFFGGLVPRIWFVSDPNPSPVLFSKGLFQGLDATVPDRVVFAGRQKVVADGGGSPPLPDWDVVVDPAQFILGPEGQGGDASVAAFWGPRSLAQGQKRTIVTYIGVGNCDHAFAGPASNPLFVGAAQTPLSVSLTNGQADPFALTAFAMNLRNNLTIPGVSAIIRLPQGLELAATNPPQQSAVLLGDLGPFLPTSTDDERSTSWNIEVNGEAAGLLPINVSLTGPTGSADVRREVNVPQGTRMRLRRTFSMVTFPFDLLDPSPQVAIGLPANEFDLLRWDPVVLDYVRVTVIRAGESYWLRLAEGVPDQTINLAGATPIKIPSGGTFVTALQQTWNQVGSPSPYAIAIKDLRFLDPVTGDIVDLQTAVRRRLVLGSIWRYDRNLGRYVRLQRTDCISPGQGIWINALRPLTVFWPEPVGLGIQIN